MDYQTAQPSLDPAFDLNRQSEYEWDALDKFLEWQQDQPSQPSNSSPSSQTSEPHFQTYDYPLFPEENAMQTINPSQSNRLSWTTQQLSPESMSPMSSFSPPRSSGVHDEQFPHIKDEPLLPRIPKVGRPRSTPVSEPGSYKTPTHARRRNQNREAQRAFRARQRQHLEELAQENKDLVGRNRELEERCEKLARAYERVLSDRMDRGVVQQQQQQQLQGNGNAGFGVPWNLDGN